MFQQVTIIGFGLMGSSIARGIKRADLARRIVAADNNPEACEIIRELGLADEVTEDIGPSVEGSDLVVICVPVGSVEGVAEEIGPYLKAGALITDIASVKRAVIDAIVPNIPKNVVYIPSHPVAGAEFSGPESGFPEIFENRWWIITPTPDTDIANIEHFTRFFEALGSRVEIMDPDHHDLVLGITSHLPHLIAYTIVGTASDLEGDLKSEVIKSPSR